MTRLFPLSLILLMAACPEPEPPESTVVEATIDLSTPVPPVDTERPGPLDTGAP